MTECLPEKREKMVSVARKGVGFTEPLVVQKEQTGNR